MFAGFSQETLDFMWGIRFNNERSWFEAHKQNYLTHLDQPMKELCQQVYQGMEKEAVARGMLGRVCRIYRDARRLHGKGPYKDHLWFCIERPNDGPSTGQPTFWFELSPEQWSYGLGYYSIPSAVMAKLRTRMDRNPQRYTRFLSRLTRWPEFVLEGPSYKREREAPSPRLQEWYNKKTFSFIHEEPISEELFSSELVTRLVKGYSYLLPIYDELATLRTDADRGEV